MRILGIDYGTKKIGLAISVNNYIRPLKILNNISGHVVENENISQIMKLINEEYIEVVVIGRNLGYEDSKEYKDFLYNLKQNIPSHIEINFVDEYKTTDSTKKTMVDAGIAKNKRNLDDSFAAAEILSRYLDSVRE